MGKFTNIVATAAVGVGRFVAPNGTADQVVECTARADLASGVSRDGAAVGAPLPIAGVGEVVRVEVGAAGVAATDEYVTIDEATGNGRAVGASSTQIAHGRNINYQAASAGEFITIEVIAPLTVP